MPIYEYQCQQCGKPTELFQGINDPVATECPYCHKDALQRLISLSGFRLKGEGWYQTDKQNAQKTTAGSSTSSEQSTKETPTGTSDSADKAIKKTEAEKSTKAAAKPTTDET